MRRLLMVLLTILGCSWSATASAWNCSVSITNIDFGNISPISTTDYTTTGTGTLTCQFFLLDLGPLLIPTVTTTVSVGLGTNSTSALPRNLGNGSNRIEYNLYVDGSYATPKIWGGASVPGAPSTISPTFSSLLGIGTFSTPFTVYAKIPAGTTLPSVPVVGNNNNTVYTSTLVATYSAAACGLLSIIGCPVSTGSVSFNVTATVINNCTITATPMAFVSTSVLSSNVRSTSTLSVRCANASSYQIALNGGTVTGNVANRQMRKAATGETISYRLASTLDGATLWGDGTAGTGMVTGTGTGAIVPLTIYGLVPAQTSPSPGDYKDTVMATIYF